MVLSLCLYYSFFQIPCYSVLFIHSSALFCFCFVLLCLIVNFHGKMFVLCIQCKNHLNRFRFQTKRTIHSFFLISLTLIEIEIWRDAYVHECDNSIPLNDSKYFHFKEMYSLICIHSIETWFGRFNSRKKKTLSIRNCLRCRMASYWPTLYWFIHLSIRGYVLIRIFFVFSTLFTLYSFLYLNIMCASHTQRQIE